MKALLLYNKISDVAATVGDHINSFCKFSEHDFKEYQVFNNTLTLEFINSYDFIVIHYSIWIELDYNLSPQNRYILSKYNKPKVVFLQDENRGVNNLVSCVHALGVNLIFSCVPTVEVSKVYNQSNLPGVKVISTRTGFVPEDLVTITKSDYEERKLDVVYRARKLSAWYGRLCYEKYKIADSFKLDANKFGLKCDISALESDRIHGKAWVDFLLSSKAVLGVESGASMFDFTGEIRRKVERHELLYPEDSFDKLERLYFPNEDYNVQYNQISPRHFEAAALKTLMILYEGSYSNILIPWRHYVPLKKDHSNIASVVDVIKSKNDWKTITDAAYNEIALNDDYKYEKFIRDFDKSIEEYFYCSKVHLHYNYKDSDSEHNIPVIADKPTIKKSTSFFNIVAVMSGLKRQLRAIISKKYWQLDRFCHENCNSSNFIKKNSSKFVRAIKNRIKLIDIYFRRFDKSKSKFIILLNAYYYKNLYKKSPIYKDYNQYLYCTMIDKHHSEGVNYSRKDNLLTLLFCKVKVCKDCKWYIGI